MSLNNATRYIAAGLQRVDFHRVDSSGLPAGITGTVTPGATGVAAGRIKAAKTVSFTTPAGEVVPVTGDNVLQGTFQFQNVSVRSFDITFAEDDFVDRAAFQNIATQSIGNHQFAGRDIAPFQLNDLLLIGVSNARIQTDDASSGLSMYSGVFSTRCQLAARGADNFVERQARSFLGTVNLDPMNAYAWGQTFKASVEGYKTSYVQDWTFAYPVTCHRWTQVGGTLVYYLSEQPCSVNLADVLIYTIDTNGTWARKTSGVTINTTARSVTFNSVNDGDAAVAWYGYVPS